MAGRGGPPHSRPYDPQYANPRKFQRTGYYTRNQVPCFLNKKSLKPHFIPFRKGIIILLFVCVLHGVFVSVKLTKKCAGSNGSISSVRAAVPTCQSFTTLNDEIHSAK